MVITVLAITIPVSRAKRVYVLGDMSERPALANAHGIELIHRSNIKPDDALMKATDAQLHSVIIDMTFLVQHQGTLAEVPALRDRPRHEGQLRQGHPP